MMPVVSLAHLKMIGEKKKEFKKSEAGKCVWKRECGKVKVAMECG